MAMDKDGKIATTDIDEESRFGYGGELRNFTLAVSAWAELK